MDGLEQMAPIGQQPDPETLMLQVVDWWYISVIIPSGFDMSGRGLKGRETYCWTTKLSTTRIARDAESVGAARGAYRHAERAERSGFWHAAFN